MAEWRNRIVGSGDENPDQLLANPANWRIHPKAQQDALSGVLTQVGWVQNVIVNQRTGHVVDGHLRVSLALSRQEPTIPVVYVDLSPDEERLILATLDPLAAMAQTDADMLEQLTANLEIEDAAVRAAIEAIDGGKHEPKAGLTDPDDVPEVPAEPITKPGDLWILGDHRLLCGDSTSAEDVARLLDGAVPNLMVTDPPYGVNYEPNWRNEMDRANGKPYGAFAVGLVANDSRADWGDAWDLFPGDVVYSWHPAGATSLVHGKALQDSGFEIRMQIIWAKNQFPIGRGDYHVKHEPCWYAVRAGKPSGRNDDRTQHTLWEIDKPHKSETGHSTQKPVECMARPIRNHEGDVYEPFSGSGTTIIACEQLGRRCYAIEIEPKYVDVAVKRWEQFTGKTAVRDA